VVSLSQLTARAPHTQGRGGANDAFDHLFALPFGAETVHDFALVSWDRPAAAPERTDLLPAWRLYTGLGLLGVATVSAVGASAALLSANDLRDSADPNASAAARADRDATARSRAAWSGVGFAVAGAAAASGLAALLWPHASAPVEVTAAPGTAMVSVHRGF